MNKTLNKHKENMNDSIKNGLLLFAKLTVCALISFAASTSAFFIGGTKEVWNIVLIISCVVLAVIMIANVVGTVIFKRLSEKIKTKQAHEFAEGIMKKIQADYDKARRNVNVVLFFSYFYVLFMIALVMLTVCALAEIFYGKLDLYIIITIAGALPLYPFINVFFHVVKKPIDMPPAPLELFPSAYPLLYDTAHDAAKKAGCNYPVKLFDAGYGVSVSLNGNIVVICMEYMYVATLTRAELYNVLLHEFAHVKNKDSARGKAYARAENAFCNDSDNFSQTISMFFTFIPTVLVAFAVNAYSTLASRHHEIEADALVAKLGDKQTYVNALAKSRMIGLFQARPRRELDFDFYASEEPTADYAAQELALFDVYRTRHEKAWDEFLAKEIPARVDSHPTFKMRREAFGCETYNAHNVETDENYKTEQKNFVALADNMMRDANSANYKQMRNDIYIEPKKIMDEYVEAQASGKELTEPQKTAAMRAFYGVDNDMAAKIADELIAAQPDAPTANYIKGLILYFDYDRECLGYFATAGKSAQFADAALELTGNFYLMTGDEDGIAEYRKNAADNAQTVHDTEVGVKMTYKTVFTPSDIDEQTTSALIERIRKETNLHVNKIYTAKYTDARGFAHYAVLLVYKRKDPSLFIEELNAAFTAIASFSDKYDLIPCFGKKGFCRKIIKTPNSLVYDASAKIIT